MVRAGRLRSRIQIHEATTTTGSLGQATQTWSQVASRFGMIEDGAGTEREVANTKQAEQGVTITIRSYPELTTKHRFYYAGKTYEIAGIQRRQQGIEGIIQVCNCVVVC